MYRHLRNSSLFLVLILFLVFSRSDNSPNQSTKPVAPLGLHPQLFYNGLHFYTGLDWVQKNPLTKFSTKIAIVPHDLLPGYMLSGFFQSVENIPNRVVLLGPNHKELGKHQLTSSIWSWQTPFGVVHPDLQTITSLQSLGLVVIDDPILSKEHSVSGLMSYISYYFPQSTVIPIIIKHAATEDDINSWAKVLSSLDDGNTLFLASIDFSHYLTSNEAAKMDEITKELIENYDIRNILNLGNDNVDSPSTLALILTLSKHLNAAGPTILFHSNSGVILNNNSIPTTSYFVVRFSKTQSDR